MQGLHPRLALTIYRWNSIGASIKPGVEVDEYCKHKPGDEAHSRRTWHKTYKGTTSSKLASVTSDAQTA